MLLGLDREKNHYRLTMPLKIVHASHLIHHVVRLGEPIATHYEMKSYPWAIKQAEQESTYRQRLPQTAMVATVLPFSLSSLLEPHKEPSHQLTKEEEKTLSYIGYLCYVAVS